MIYVRGQPQDYDDRARSGLVGWDWKSVAPYFKRMENHILGADAVRGAGGPVGIFYDSTSSRGLRKIDIVGAPI